MIQVHKIKKGVYSFESHEQLNKVVFINNKLWMSEKEISKLFNTKKTQIRQILSKIFLEGEYNIQNNIISVYNDSTNKQKNYYSLDVILSIWYRLKSFEETKFIITGNRILKEYENSEKSRLWLFQESVKNFSKLIKNFQTKIIY